MYVKRYDVNIWADTRGTSVDIYPWFWTLVPMASLVLPTKVVDAIAKLLGVHSSVDNVPSVVAERQGSDDMLPQHNNPLLWQPIIIDVLLLNFCTQHSHDQPTQMSFNQQKKWKLKEYPWMRYKKLSAAEQKAKNGECRDWTYDRCLIRAALYHLS